MSVGRGLCRVPKTTSILTKSIVRAYVCAAPRPFVAPSRCCDSPPRYARPYSSQVEGRTSRQETEDISEAVEEPFDIDLEEELLAIQNAAIAEIEAQLGTSLEQAVLKDGLAQRLQLARGVKEDQDELDVSEEHGIEDRLIDLELMRFEDKSAGEVARKARSIFGDYLPDNALKSEELVVYKRLYGAPVSSREAYLGTEEHNEIDESQKNILLDADGSEIPYHLESAEEIVETMDSRNETVAQAESAMGVPIDQAMSNESRAMEVAMALEGEVMDEDYDVDEDDEEAADTRSHPLTGLGRFATTPRTKFFSSHSFVQPIDKIMSDFSNNQLKEMCEKTFGGPGLPDSALTPRSGRARQQVPIPLTADQQSMGQMEANAFVTTIMPATYASISAVLVETRKRLGSSWLTKLLARNGGPRILDAGSAGVGVLAWEEIVQAHWDSLHSSDAHPPPPPRSKRVVLTGSDTLRSRAASMLDNTTFVPRLPDYVNVRQAPTIDDERPVQARKQFDVIIASHSLFSLKEEWERKQHVQNLWSLLEDNGGVLILIEKGIPRGFETIAGARDMILERYITTPPGQKTAYSEDAAASTTGTDTDQRRPGMIIAPCTNHDRCPLYKTSGISKGRKDVCSFQQRYIRPPFLQRILGARDRNHDDVDFSYVAFMKGDDLRTRAFSTWNHIHDPLSAPSIHEAEVKADTQQIAISEIQQGFEYYDPTVPDAAIPPPTHVLPRIMSPPIKRKGHVTMDLCTPNAEIRRWTVPKSFSRQAYRDARKSRWGDLWALGAKTAIARNLKVGTPLKDFLKGEGMADSAVEKKPRSRKARLEAKIDRAIAAEQEKRSEEELEEAEFLRMVEEEHLDEDEDDGTIDMDTLLPRKKTPRKSVASPAKGAQAPRTEAKAENTRQASKGTRTQRPGPSEILANEPIEYAPGRMGQDDPLAAWGEHIEYVRQQEEASRAKLNRTGRRASARNTQRFKRDMRRAAKTTKNADDVE